MSTALITGSSRGLGLEFVRQYAADGWRVLATCRTPEKAEALKKLAQKYPAIQIEQLDVIKPISLASLVEKLQGEAIDLLINNAGIASDSDQLFGAIDPDRWGQVFRVNSIAPIMVTQALRPNMRCRRGGKIVMISSRYGSIGQNLYPEEIVYGTSKAALNMAMRNVAALLAPEGLVLASLNPGWVKTDMGGPDANITPEVSVRGMRKVIAGLTLEQSGQFFRYNGEQVPW